MTINQTKPPPYKISPAPTQRTPSTGTTQPTPQPTITESTPLPSGILPIEFSLENVAASLTNSQLYRFVGSAASAVARQLSFVAPIDGSVVALSLISTEAITAGSLTLSAFRNGVAMSNATLVWSSLTYAVASFGEGTHAFGRGDRIDLRITTTASFAPITADIEAFMFLAQRVI